MPLASGFPSSGTHCSSPQARLQRSPVRGKPTVQLVEWFTVIAAGDGVKQCSGATGGLVAAISENGSVWEDRGFIAAHLIQAC